MRYKFDVEISGRHKNSIGKLEAIDESCGTNHKREGDLKLYKNFGNDKDDYHLKKTRCTRQNCPVCFRTYSAIRGQSIASKLWGISKLNGIRLRHWTINYREKDGVAIPPPATFKEIKNLENQFKKILNDEHGSLNDGELCYTLTIHPYSGTKTCTKCGLDQKGIKNVWKCQDPECHNKTFENPRWIRGWHWHLITNFYAFDFNSLNRKMAEKGFQIQDLSKSGNYGQVKRIINEQTLARIVAYEFSHAMYIPFKARDVCRFIGGFHHGKFKSEFEERDIVVRDKFNNPYTRVKINDFSKGDLKLNFITEDEVVLDENGMPELQMERVKIYFGFRKVTDEEMDARYASAGKSKRKKKPKPVLVESLIEEKKRVKLKFEKSIQEQYDFLDQMVKSISSFPF